MTLIPDNIDNQLISIQDSKSDIKTAIENKGVTVGIDAILSDYAGLIDDIVTIDNLQTKTYTVTSSTNTTFNVTPDSNYDGLLSVTVDMSYIENELDDILGV